MYATIPNIPSLFKETSNTPGTSILSLEPQVLLKTKCNTLLEASDKDIRLRSFSAQPGKDLISSYIS
jgi:hypothetical protein